MIRSIPNMKKLTFILLALFGLLFTGCENKIDKAHAAYDRGIELMYNTSSFDEAERQFTKVIKYDKNNFEAYFYRGCTKFNRGLLDEAIVDFEKAIELKPDYADAEFALGRIYFIKKDNDMACYYYKAADRDGKANLEDYLKGCPK